MEDGAYLLVPLGHGCREHRSHGHACGATAATVVAGDRVCCSCGGHIGAY